MQNDEISNLRLMSTLLFKGAKNLRKLWYDAKQGNAPLDIIFGDGLNWLKNIYNLYIQKKIIK